MSSIFDDNDPLRFLGDKNSPEETPAEIVPVPEAVPSDADIDAAEAANEPKTHRDQQRGALEDLLELTKECADREAAIEQQFQTASADTLGAGQRKMTDAERRYKGLQDQVAAKFDEKNGQIDAQYQQSLAALKLNDQKLRQRAKAEYDQAQLKAKKDYDQAIWLAESVLEAEEQKAAEELKKATELNVAQTEFLDTKDGDQNALMTRYNQRPPPSEGLAAIKDAEASVDPVASFNQHKEVIEAKIKALQNLTVPRIFVGATPALIVVLVIVIAAAIPQGIAGTLTPQWQPMGIWAGGALVLMIVLMMILKSVARKQVVAVYVPLRNALDAARIANDNMLSQATLKHDDDLAKAKRQQKGEAQAARDRAAPILDAASKKRDAALQAGQAEVKAKSVQYAAVKKKSLTELEQWRDRKSEEVKKLFDAETVKLGDRASSSQSQLEQQHA
ncbi:MAG TPA: hypothetical protein VGG44_04550, partial [Tepidisphaeraceae bacterium]